MPWFQPSVKSRTTSSTMPCTRGDARGPWCTKPLIRSAEKNAARDGSGASESNVPSGTVFSQSCTKVGVSIGLTLPPPSGKVAAYRAYSRTVHSLRPNLDHPAKVWVESTAIRGRPGVVRTSGHPHYRRPGLYRASWLFHLPLPVVQSRPGFLGV